MPRKEYKTITVKVKAFEKFARALTDARKRDPEVENSEFLIYLLERYAKSRRR